jgi:hypothetical protein
MQDGLSANTTRGATISVVRANGGEGGAIAYKGVEGGNGPGSALNREDSSDGNRRHQRADSTDSGRAPLAKSQNGGNDTEGFIQTVRVGPMARARGCISRVSDGTGSDSQRSATDGRGRRPYRRGEARLISHSSEAKAYSAVADIDTHLLPQAPSTAGGRPSQQHSQYGSSKILVREGSPGRAPAEARGGKPRGTQYKHHCATIPAHRTWPRGHKYHGRSKKIQRRGGERYHLHRRPQYSRTRTDMRRRFHAGRTPGPRWPHGRAPGRGH